MEYITEGWMEHGQAWVVGYGADNSSLKPLTVWITTNCGKFLEMGTPDHFTCLLRILYAGQEATEPNRTWNNGLVPNWKKSTSRLYIVTLLI